MNGLTSADPHLLFRRCVQCPSGAPSCPTCPEGQTCSLQSQSCDTCASTTCVKIGSLPGQATPKTSAPIGAIVGGVIGGVIVLVIATYLLYRFVLKRKQKAETWDPPEKRDQSTLARGARQSTRSAHSIASTVLTRASNVIQIAYIPGVTVRSPPESPMVPPVPVLPGASGSTQSTPHLEQHFFMPGDLRDSTWSDSSSIMDSRISIAPSLARGSVATEIYRTDAIVPPVPAQHAWTAKANVVSVRSGTTTPGTGSTSTSKVQTPRVPQLQSMASNSSIVARNVQARPIEVKKSGSAVKVPTLGNLARQASQKGREPERLQEQSSSEKSVPMYYDEKEVVFSPATIFEDSPVSPIVKPKPSYVSENSGHSSSISAIMPSAGPLGSGPGTTTHRHTNSGGLTAMIEDAMNRAARDPAHTGLGNHQSRPELNKHDSGPFSDANEVKENSP